jgi:pimeloyl-ACP methyl ester carboxylesterase
MCTYVFVHGAWHGAWCWKKIIPLIQQAGHRAIAPDLPGHGEDTAPVGHASLQTYAERVVAILDAQQFPIILVGHSMAGVVITRVAEMRPEKIVTLVYLAAHLPQNGQSINAIKRSYLGQSGNMGAPLPPDPDIIIDTKEGINIFKKERAREVLYHDCSDEDVAYAVARLCPESLAIFETPLTLTEERFGRVPRVYIETLEDRRVPPELQKKMYTAQPCRRVFSLIASHSPLFSVPEELGAILTSPEVLRDCV